MSRSLAVPRSDRNLRFGVMALAHEYIDARQFASACAQWNERRASSLADLLVEQGWLSSEQRADIDEQLASEEAARDPHHAGPTTPTLSLPVLPSISKLDLDLDFDVDVSDTLSMRERITLRDLHSSGGIGEVWRAYDEVLGREIALKRLKQDQAAFADNRARFYREARITGQLEHPGIVPVYDYSPSERGSHCFYTMRFLSGRTLREVIAEFHARRAQTGEAMVGGSLLQLLAHFTSICNTMAFAHSRGVVHRDLKGDNVIIGDFGEVVVLDWGLAKRVGAQAEPSSARPEPADSLFGMSVDATMQGERLGTPAYMAPEQAQGRVDEIDERTDVYGLAAILYELLTGRPPFIGDDAAAVMDAVARELPEPPRALVPEVPAVLERICLRGLAKSRDERQQSVHELAAEVQGFLNRLAERHRTEREREHFFDLSLDLLAIVDRAGSLTQSSTSWEATLGWPADARDQRALADFVHADDRAELQAALAQVWSGTPVVEFELRLLRADGGHCWIHGRARSLPDEPAIYLVGHDVTERRQTERRFRGLLESAPDATCVIDEQGTIVLVNAQLERMFGYGREQLVGESIEVLIPAALRSRHADHVRRYVSNPRTRPMANGLDLTAARKSGETFAVQISLGPVETETGMLIACSLRERPG